MARFSHVTHRMGCSQICRTPLTGPSGERASRKTSEKSPNLPVTLKPTDFSAVTRAESGAERRICDLWEFRLRLSGVALPREVRLSGDAADSELKSSNSARR